MNKINDFQNKTAVFVGGTGGIGKALADEAAAQGARVIVVGQTRRNENVEFLKADLSLMANAKKIAEQLKAEKIDFLVFTTGIFAAPNREETSEKLERDMAVSFLNRLLMLDILCPYLKDEAKICIWGYPGFNQKGNIADLNSDKKYSAMTAHMNTVAGNEILVNVFSKKYPHLIFYGFNPGLIKTNIRDNFFGKNSLKSKFMEFLIGILTPTAKEYAQKIVPLFLENNPSDTFFNRKGKIIAGSKNLTLEYGEEFLAKSRELLKSTVN